jgi:hypothetical protein
LPALAAPPWRCCDRGKNRASEGSLGGRLRCCRR